VLAGACKQSFVGDWKIITAAEIFAVQRKVDFSCVAGTLVDSLLVRIWWRQWNTRCCVTGTLLDPLLELMLLCYCDARWFVGETNVVASM
jgi:hypothetical protein